MTLPMLLAFLISREHCSCEIGTSHFGGLVV